jgi:hypothetical protein
MGTSSHLKDEEVDTSVILWSKAFSRAASSRAEGLRLVRLVAREGLAAERERLGFRLVEAE